MALRHYFYQTITNGFFILLSFLKDNQEEVSEGNIKYNGAGLCVISKFPVGHLFPQLPWQRVFNILIGH